MICENVRLTWKTVGVHGYQALDQMTRCTAEAATVRTSGRDSKKTQYCTPCAERYDTFCARLDALVLEARRKRGEICGEYGATDPYNIEPGDVCAYRVYADPDEATELFEVLKKPVTGRIARGGPLDDDRPYTWMEERHGRVVWQVWARALESGREGWVFYRNTESIWRKEERKASV